MKLELGKTYVIEGATPNNTVEIIAYAPKENLFIGEDTLKVIKKYTPDGRLVKSQGTQYLYQLVPIKKKFTKTFWVNLYESGFGMAFEDLEKATTAAEHYSFIKRVSFTLEEEVEV